MSYLEELANRSAPSRQLYDDDDADDSDDESVARAKRHTIDPRVALTPRILPAAAASDCLDGRQLKARHLIVGSTDLASVFLREWLAERASQLSTSSATDQDKQSVNIVKVAILPLTFRKPFGVYQEGNDMLHHEIGIWVFTHQQHSTVIAPLHVLHMPLEMYAPVKRAVLSLVNYNRLTVLNTRPISTYQSSSYMDKTSSDLIARYLTVSSVHDSKEQSHTVIENMVTTLAMTPLLPPNTISTIGSAFLTDAMYAVSSETRDIQALLLALYFPSGPGRADTGEVVSWLAQAIACSLTDELTPIAKWRNDYGLDGDALSRLIGAVNSKCNESDAHSSSLYT